MAHEVHRIALQAVEGAEAVALQSTEVGVDCDARFSARASFARVFFARVFFARVFFARVLGARSWRRLVAAHGTASRD